MIKIEKAGKQMQIMVEDETIDSFIKYILKEYPKDAGHFGLKNFNPQDMGDLLWGNPRCEYAKGTVTPNTGKLLNPKYINRKIKRVRCEGDPKHRDYLITI